MREEDVPKREAQKAMEGKERVEEAREVAKRKLGLKTGKRKGKRAVKIASEM